MNHLALLALILLASLAPACAPKILQPAGPRPPISPDSVTFHQTPPSQYEDWGLIAVEGDLIHDRPHDANAIGDALKAAAAARGANGILLAVPPGQGFYRVGAFYRGIYYTFPARLHPERAVAARAIHVPER
jgi:hypothetical protein